MQEGHLASLEQIQTEPVETEVKVVGLSNPQALPVNQAQMG